MRAVDVIIKKRDRGELTRQEIEYFIEGFASGEIPDYQAAAWAMAVLLNGMTRRETADLTLVMAHTGEILDLSNVVPIAVDKHSTGGVGDKTTLVVEPTVAACGLPVGKMSGRGLSFTGGTLDKLESIPGYRTDLTTAEFLKQLGDIGLVLTGQSADLAPADGKLYALRDVTGTVQCLPLIASSVMSKKIAAGAFAIVLDVKLGLGAFMPDLEQARELSELMVSIARQAGRKAVSILSDMNQPLGCAVGNTLELREAIETLHGSGPPEFRRHCLVIAGHMLALGGRAVDEMQGSEMAEKALQDGSAWERFKTLVSTQGGNVRYIEHPELLPSAARVEQIQSPRSGFITQVHARKVGDVACTLGAGRLKKGEPIDHAVGVLVHCRVGDEVQIGQPLFTIHANHQSRLDEARPRLIESLGWSDEPVEALPLFYGVIS